MVSLSLEPPPSSRPARSPGGGGLKVAFVAIAILAAAGGGFYLGRRTAPRTAPQQGASGEARPPAAGQAAAVPAPAAPAAPAGAPAGAQAPVGAPAPSSPAPGAAPAPAATSALSPTAPRRIAVTLSGPLEESIAAAVPKEDRPLAEELTQVVNRLLVWDLQVARDGRKGDRIDLIYTPAAAAAPGLPPNGEPVVQAVRYASQKLGKVLAAYRYQVPGAKWARYYRQDGAELEERLVDSPIADYDQITSLLRDGRRHKGVDFRTPVGTPVRAPFDGVIERRNWNFAGNGNCVDIADPATGRHAIFLHLDVLPKELQPGKHVKKGEQIALSGNTGHSTAPHLHYQLEAPDGRILDPFEVLQVRRVTLDAAALPGFQAERVRIDQARGDVPVPAALAAPTARAGRHSRYR